MCVDLLDLFGFVYLFGFVVVTLIYLLFNSCAAMRKEMPYHMISEKLFSLLTLIQIHQMKQ